MPHRLLGRCPRRPRLIDSVCFGHGSKLDRGCAWAANVRRGAAARHVSTSRSGPRASASGHLDRAGHLSALLSLRDRNPSRRLHDRMRWRSRGGSKGQMGRSVRTFGNNGEARGSEPRGRNKVPWLGGVHGRGSAQLSAPLLASMSCVARRPVSDSASIVTTTSVATARSSAALASARAQAQPGAASGLPGREGWRRRHDTVTAHTPLTSLLR